MRGNSKKILITLAILIIPTILTIPTTSYIHRNKNQKLYQKTSIQESRLNNNTVGIKSDVKQMEIQVGNIVRLKETFNCQKYEDKEWVNITDKVELEVASTGKYEEGKEYCLVTGNGFNLKTDCNNLIKIREKAKVPRVRHFYN